MLVRRYHETGRCSSIQSYLSSTYGGHGNIEDYSCGIGSSGMPTHYGIVPCVIGAQDGYIICRPRLRLLCSEVVAGKKAGSAVMSLDGVRR